MAHNGVYSTLLRLQCNLPEAVGASIHDGPDGAALGGNGRCGISPNWERHDPQTVGNAGHPLAGRRGVPPNSERLGGRSLQNDDGDGGPAWLDPGQLRINEGPGDTLRVTRDGACIEDVIAVRAFPAAFERQYLSVRRREASGHECELGMIASLDDWPPSDRTAVCRFLERRYAMRRIREIRQIHTDGNQLTLSVATDGGPAAVRLKKPGEGSQPFGPNGLLLTDGDSGYYLIPDRGALPKRQQRLLTLYLGD